MRSGVILVTNPGGGSGMFGNTTAGPLYVYARRWRTIGARLIGVPARVRG
jgi:hypothetical protein